MAGQCDAESKRASCVRSRSQRSEQPSTRPVFRPVRTQATERASKPGSCFSNVAAGTPAWSSAPVGGRTCRRRHALRSIAGTPQPSAATVARNLQRRACDRHQGRRLETPCAVNIGYFTGRGANATGEGHETLRRTGIGAGFFYYRFSGKICALPPPNQRRKLPCRAGIRFWFRQLSDPWRDRFAHGRRDFGGWEANGIGTCCDASTGELARWLGARHSRSRVFRRRVVERPTYWRQSQLVGRGRLAVPKCASTELATEQLKVVCGRAFAAPSSQCQPGPGPFQHRLALSLPSPARPVPSPC